MAQSPKQNEEIEEVEEDSLCTDIANLAAALSSLSEIDSGLLNKGRQAKLARMKRLIFDTLVHYTDCLPDEEEE